jgi:integrase
LTAVMTGLRRGELLALRWADVDWNKNQLWVRRSLWKGQIIAPKSKLSSRCVDLTPSLIIQLKKHKLASPISSQDLLFCNSEGNTWDPDALVKRQFLPALRRAGIRQVRFHDLRHTNVALRIAQGQPIKYIQHQMGHASIQTTMDRYGHLMPEIGAKQAKKLDDILDRSSSAS